MKKIAITTGDQDGIGFEVTAKALAFLGPQKSVLFFVFRSSKSEKRYFKNIEKKFHVYSVRNLEDALDLAESLADRRALIEIVQESSPAKWVEDAARQCLIGGFNSLVTAPLSKQEIHRSGMKDIGHTDILKRISNCSQAFMCFVGSKFNVILATGHLPTSKVESQITQRLLKTVFDLALASRKYLNPSTRRRPLAILGLNPHAGDQGIIGTFDDRIVSPSISSFGKKSDLKGPLVPDVAFLPENWKKYSFYVAQYHDQGLIPFKMVHGFESGVHLTLGLPIKRTSVDHGTAKDIFGKNLANPKSMIEAINWGIRLAHGERGKNV